MYNNATKVKVALTPEYFDRQSDETEGAARKSGSNEGGEEERKGERERLHDIYMYMYIRL